ncbi:MAG: shikimate kinase [Candidatus Goldiibacteriota bacterium]
MENIILIGFMGSGKTTVGRSLAKKSGLKYVDLDRMIVKEAGMPIKKIFALLGEEAFRNFESKTVIRASKLKKSVIATGGGVIKRPENIRRLKKAGLVVYLKASLGTIVNRIKKRDDRPLFDMNNLDSVKKLYNSRMPVYKKAAGFTVDTDKNSVQEITKIIIEKAGGLNLD